MSFRFPVAAHNTHSFENWDFPAQSIEKVFLSVFLFPDNLLLYLGRWDVDVAIEKTEIEGKKEKES